jgi:hypothetical protein
LFATCSIQIPNGFPSVTPFFNDRFSIVTYMWRLNCFWLPRPKWTVNKFVLVVQWQLILEEVFLGYINFKMQSMIHFWTPLFSFRFCVFGCLLMTIVWNLGWVEVIKSLAKGYLLRILRIFWTTLNLDFSKFYFF